MLGDSIYLRVLIGLILLIGILVLLAYVSLTIMERSPTTSPVITLMELSPTTSPVINSSEPTTIVETSTEPLTSPTPEPVGQSRLTADWITIQTRAGGLIWTIRTFSASFKTHSTDSPIHNSIPLILSFLGLKLTDTQPFHFESRIVVDRALYEIPRLTFWWIVDRSQVHSQPNYTQRCRVYRLPAYCVPPWSQFIYIDRQLLSLTGLSPYCRALKFSLVNQTNSRNKITITTMDASGYYRSIARLVVTDTNLPIVSRDPSTMRMMSIQQLTRQPYFISNEDGNELCQVDPSFHTNIRLLTQESAYKCLSPRYRYMPEPQWPCLTLENRIHILRSSFDTQIMFIHRGIHYFA